MISAEERSICGGERNDALGNKGGETFGEVFDADAPSFFFGRARGDGSGDASGDTEDDARTRLASTRTPVPNSSLWLRRVLPPRRGSLPRRTGEACAACFSTAAI